MCVDVFQKFIYFSYDTIQYVSKSSLCKASASMRACAYVYARTHMPREGLMKEEGRMYATLLENPKYVPAVAFSNILI